jgi:hypothetical protein
MRFLDSDEVAYEARGSSDRSAMTFRSALARCGE